MTHSLDRNAAGSIAISGGYEVDNGRPLSSVYMFREFR